MLVEPLNEGELHASVLRTYSTKHGPFLIGRTELAHAQQVIQSVCVQESILDLWLVGYWRTQGG